MKRDMAEVLNSDINKNIQAGILQVFSNSYTEIKTTSIRKTLSNKSLHSSLLKTSNATKTTKTQW